MENNKIYQTIQNIKYTIQGGVNYTSFIQPHTFNPLWAVGASRRRLSARDFLCLIA